MAQSTSESCSVEGRRPRTIYVGSMVRYPRQTVKYAVFLGIPYAVRPEGLKRYQAPETLPCDEIPEGQALPIYTANVRGKDCAQLYQNKFSGSADCLYLNIFLPRHPDAIDELLPVLVFIHGGGFTYGGSDPEVYSPDPMLRHNLVLVTMNYRLGILGFMNAQTKKCPGNTGLKDQVKALEWIRDNIASFRGDPNNVTISGCSAGATCVNFHLIAPASKGLFHKAIVQSGGIYCPWGYRGHQCEVSRMLLNDSEFHRLFHAADGSLELLQREADRLIRADRLDRHPKSFSPSYGPTKEKFREGAFIADSLEDMMKNVDHDIPVMAGICEEEGVYQFIVNQRTISSDWVDNNETFRQILMGNFRWDSQTARDLFREIRRKYFPNRRRTFTVDKELGLTKFFRDIFFRRFYDNFRFGPEKNVHKNLYVYRFDHVSEISAVRREKIEHLHGATHGDDVNYLYCPTYMKQNFDKCIYAGRRQNKEIEEVMNHLCSLWANFCRTGVPKSDSDPNKTEWRRHTEENPCFLRISKNLTLIEESLFKEDWDWLNEFVNPQPTVASPAVTPE